MADNPGITAEDIMASDEVNMDEQVDMVLREELQANFNEQL